MRVRIAVSEGCDWLPEYGPHPPHGYVREGERRFLSLSLTVGVLSSSLQAQIPAPLTSKLTSIIELDRQMVYKWADGYSEPYRSSLGALLDELDRRHIYWALLATDESGSDRKMIVGEPVEALERYFQAPSGLMVVTSGG